MADLEDRVEKGINIMSQESEEVKQEDYRSSQIRESLDKGEGNLDPTAFGSMSKMPDINQGEGE